MKELSGIQIPVAYTGFVGLCMRTLRQVMMYKRYVNRSVFVLQNEVLFMAQQLNKKYILNFHSMRQW